MNEIHINDDEKMTKTGLVSPEEQAGYLNQQPHLLFIMDSYGTLNHETETSLLLMGELLSRGVSVYWVELQDLVLKQNKLDVMARQVVSVQPFMRDVYLQMSIDRFDALIIRTDPPFDETYLHLTYLLDFVPSHVKQFNKPEALRAFNEKLLPLKWPHLSPATITTMNKDALEAFLIEKKDIIVKPLGDCSGRGIKRLQSDMPDLSRAVESVLLNSLGKSRFITAQEFLPAIKFGDKRVFLVGGVPVGIVNRVPVEGSYLGNIHQGARCETSSLTLDEIQALEEIAPFLIKNGLLIVGADFIGGKLTELNITSPSALRQINAVTGQDIHLLVIDALLKEIKMATLAH